MEKVCSCRNKQDKRWRVSRFERLSVSSGLRLLIKEQRIFSKVVKISDFRILSGWIEQYKPALSKLAFSWDNLYCLRVVVVSLAANIGKLQPLVSEDNFFGFAYNHFCSDLLLCDIIDFLKIEK